MLCLGQRLYLNSNYILLFSFITSYELSICVLFNLSNTLTYDRVKDVKTALNTTRTQYCINMVLLGFINRLVFGQVLRCMYMCSYCINASVKQYHDV